MGHRAWQDQAEGPGSASCPGHRSAAPAGHDGAPSKAPDANAVPLPNCIPTPRPSWSTQTEPQKAEITLDTGPEPKEHVYCPRRLILLRGLGHTRCQLSAGSRRRHAHRQKAHPAGQGLCQVEAGVCTCPEGPPPHGSASPSRSPRICRVRVGPDPHPLSVYPQREGRTPDGSLVPETQKLPEQSHDW